MDIEKSKVPFGVFEIPGGFLKAIQGEDEDAEPVIKRFCVVTLKEMTGHEEDILSNDKLTVTERLHKVLGRCITEIATEDGSECITDKDTLLTLPNKLLMSDIVVLLIRLRQVTVEDLYRFQIRCPGCTVAQMKGINLSTLEVHPVKGDVLSRVRTFMLRDEREAVWEMMTGRHEKEQASKKIKKDARSRATQALMVRVKTIDNEPVTPVMLKDLSQKEREALRREFDQEGGIETSFDVTCNACGIEFVSELEIGGGNFFSHSEPEQT